MHENNRPQRVLLLGSGALQIGQAGEFDYSGSQALKALKEEGIYTVLINPNIATVQTDKGMADKIYFLPVQPEFVEKILRAEKCDALLLSFGGQTALNCGLELEKSGVLEKLQVKVLGTPVSTIRDTEDRHLFVERLKEIDVYTARSKAVNNVSSALEAAKKIGFPVMLRSGFSLGGKGSSIVNNEKECLEIVQTAFASVPQILVEECLTGWKEIEYEVVRDADNNCITVCNMENIDPMGIHTGESIVVAPSQTLDNYDYQMLRDIAIKTISHLGIVGECNIQYALHPKSREYRVIEVNARLSRSSALASKATGYPLAYVAAKIGLGYRLDEIPNAITKVTTSFFEPALDYIVCKVPRWDLAKFDGAEEKIGSEMKSVGEVMAIGRSFPEAFQKALRMIETGVNGFDWHKYEFKDLEKAISVATPYRIFVVATALAKGMTVERIHELSKIDLFFLYEMKGIVNLELDLIHNKQAGLNYFDQERMLLFKRFGFSDKQIAFQLYAQEDEVRKKRRELAVIPYLAQIDTLAAEFPAETNFLYLTYGASKSDIQPTQNKKILFIGSGCYRIGSSVEFDWCGVSAVKIARELGYEVIFVNCNPETVSTDYDNCEKLVFDEISLETIIELYDAEKPEGVIVAVGGQTANNLALKLYQAGIKILGTHPKNIDIAEDREKFSALLDTLNIKQPAWAKADNLRSLEARVEQIGGFPVLVRPSYVLSGSAMRVAYNYAELTTFLANAKNISAQYPVVMSKFETMAKEIEFDGVAQKGKLILTAISEHVENAGVHSGDATLVFPAQNLPYSVMHTIENIAATLANALEINGPFNLQLLYKNNELKVIELNLRASRSFPFVSKVLWANFIHVATRVMLGEEMMSTLFQKVPSTLNYLAVKAPQFSFSRIKGADPRLGVEMASTGEVACFGKDKDEALLKAYLACGFRRPQKGVFLEIDSGEDPQYLQAQARKLKNIGLNLFSRGETFCKLIEADIQCSEVIALTKQDNTISFLSLINEGMIDWVVSIPGAARVVVDLFGVSVRKAAVDLNVPLTTDLNIFTSLTNAVIKYDINNLEINSWDQYI